MQNWQTSSSLALSFSAVKKWILWTPIPSPVFGNGHRMTQVELLSFVIQVSIYILYDYICYSGKKQTLSVKWDVLNFIILSYIHANSIFSVRLGNLTTAQRYLIWERKYFHGITDTSWQAAGKIWHLKNLVKRQVKLLRNNMNRYVKQNVLFSQYLNLAEILNSNHIYYGLLKKLLFFPGQHHETVMKHTYIFPP